MNRNVGAIYHLLDHISFKGHLILNPDGPRTFNSEYLAKAISTISHIGTWTLRLRKPTKLASRALEANRGRKALKPASRPKSAAKRGALASLLKDHMNQTFCWSHLPSIFL